MNEEQKRYFFCGIGGSGMLPLAMILKGRGARVAGSDRALDQGRTPEKFDYLRARGIELFPQDGTGLQSADDILVASAAVEDTVPDVAAAKRVGAARMTRAELLSRLFNAAPVSIGVAGTSGKSTTTGMIAVILEKAGRAPTVMNGAVMKNFVAPDAPFSSAVVGGDAVFVSEVDESDGSIALYDPTIALVTNVSVDHKTIEELRALFGGFLARAGTAVFNADNDEAREIGAAIGGAKAISFGRLKNGAEFGCGPQMEPMRDGVLFTLEDRRSGEQAPVRLSVPGRHNVENALAAAAACSAAGLSMAEIVAGLEAYEGVTRRFDRVGEAGGVIVYDDFGHNPDKIAATLRTLKEFPGRLLVLFQPHGFGPLRLMKDEFIDCFAEHLGPEDRLVMPEPVYFGGTVDRSVSSRDIIDGIAAAGRCAEAFPDRDAAGAALLAEARPGDRLVVMGARDDTLSAFAAGLLEKLKG